MDNTTNALTKDTVWRPEANGKMPLSTMVDLLYNNKLVKNFDGKMMLYRATLLYIHKKHSSLLNDMVEIFCGEKVFTPSDISNTDSNEQHLFFIIDAIIEIDEFYRMETAKKDGYKKEFDKYLKAHNIIQSYSVANVPFLFPPHKNEIIEAVSKWLNTVKRGQQTHKIISAIKKHFDISSVTATNLQKHNREYDEMIERLNTKTPSK